MRYWYSKASATKFRTFDVTNWDKNFAEGLEIETHLLEIETNLHEIETALSEIETNLHEIETAWLEIKIVS